MDYYIDLLKKYSPIIDLNEKRKNELIAEIEDEENYAEDLTIHDFIDFLTPLCEEYLINQLPSEENSGIEALRRLTCFTIDQIEML